VGRRCDLDLWNAASIVSYLRSTGGNVLFLGRRGQEYLNPSRAARLGLRWAESAEPALAAATAAQPDMLPMAATASQLGAVFETAFDAPETQLLLTESTSFGVPRGIAAWRHPPQGGTVRASGGHFACVSGRPYRWEHTAMRANVRTILLQRFGEPATTTAAPPPALAVTRLLDPVPNPSNPAVTIRWELAGAERVRLRLYTPAGRLVRTLVDAPRATGPGSVRWDGRDDGGRNVASGVYLVQFEAGSVHRATKLQLVR
jgi:hypothetical protein